MSHQKGREGRGNRERKGEARVSEIALQVKSHFFLSE